MTTVDHRSTDTDFDGPENQAKPCTDGERFLDEALGRLADADPGGDRPVLPPGCDTSRPTGGWTTRKGANHV